MVDTVIQNTSNFHSNLFLRVNTTKIVKKKINLHGNIPCFQ